MSNNDIILSQIRQRLEILYQMVDELEREGGGGGGGGTTNYNELSNKPSVNGVVLMGNKTTSDLGIVENVQANWNETNSAAPSYIKNKPTIPTPVTVDQTYSGTSANAQSGTAVAQALSTKVDKVTGKGLSTNDFTDADKANLTTALAKANAAAPQETTYTKNETNALLAEKADLVDGKVPASQLPSYVDDALEYASTSAFPATGESGKIYIATDTNKTYRWGGTAYVEISESLALGETASTAYAGNKGKANADAIAAIKDGQNIDSFGDVETALSGKANSTDLASVATSGSYNDLSNKPTLGTILTGTASGSNNTWVTTGISFTVPAGKKFIFIATLFYTNSLPAGIKIGISSDPTDETINGKLWNTSNSGDDNYLSVSGVCDSRSSDRTYYCSAKNNNASVSNKVALWYAII